MLHVGPQRNKHLLHWKKLFTEDPSYLDVQITNGLATVYLDETQGKKRNPKNVCDYISYQAGCTRVVEGERGYFPEADIKL